MSLSIQEAKDLITELKEKEIALGRAPETWYTYENHVYGAASAARTIAEKIKDMNPEKVYISALLHDICRTEEDREQRFHGLLGYEKLIDKDESAARSAITHMFPWNELPAFENCSKMFYGNKKDYDFVAAYIQNIQTTDTDLLIQLADTLANKDGIVTLEQRAKEYAERCNIIIPKEKLQPRYELKAYFDNKVGCNIYSLFTKLSIPAKER